MTSGLVGGWRPTVHAAGRHHVACQLHCFAKEEVAMDPALQWLMLVCAQMSTPLE